VRPRQAGRPASWVSMRTGVHPKAAVITFLSAALASCFAPVLERQCERDVDCGSGYRCIAATCMSLGAGDGGRAGNGGTGGSSGGGTSGGASSGGPGGGAAGGVTVCSPSNCPSGCCNFLTNACIPLTAQTNASCGIGGRQCLSCAPNDFCKDGTCTGPAACDFDTCPNGCCQGNSCVPTTAQTSTTCGVGGGTCQSCAAGGGICNNGTCQTVQMCNAGSCPNGCCQGNNCVPFSAQSPGTCGTAGQACRACGVNQTCITGSCATTICNPGNCPNGCCQGNVCVQLPNQSSTNCGRGGNACQQCAAGQACAGGQCVTQGCGPQTCMGCCVGGTCTRGFDNVACGTGGQQCVQCPAGFNCVNGTCLPCGPTTCPSGCCQQGFCQPGNLGGACGMGGSACLICPPGTMCQMQRCVPVAPPASVGSPCTVDPDCAGLGMGAICKRFTSSFNATYQGGYCTLRCGTGVGCPTGSSCASAPAQGESDAICLKSCMTVNDCRTPGYNCYQFAANVAGCWIFPTPPLVDAGTPPGPDAGRPVGAACTNDNQCQPPPNAFCMPPTFAGLNTGYVGGYCSRTCGATASCPAGSVCITENFGPGGSFTSCKTVCSTPGMGQGSCRPSYICQANAAGAAWCGPRCTNQSFQCPNGGMCNMTTGYCQ